MKKLLGSLALFLALGGSVSGQVGNISNPVGANLNVQDAGTCLTGGSNLIQQLPINASTTTVTLAGTFTATVLVRESNNGGVNWTTAATLSSAGTTSYSTNGFSHLCVDITAYTSGVVQTTILTGLLQVQSVISGGSSVSPNSPISANQAQGPTYNVLNYAGGLTINDAQRIRDGVTAGGATKTVTSATANFQTTDVGKFIACVYASGAQAVTVGTTITARNSATSVSISANDNGAGNTESCVWYSNKADPAIRAAILAATPVNANSGDPNSKPVLGNSGTAYCPEGGYAVTVNAGLGALLTFAGSGGSIGPNFIGAGKTKCNIYVLADSADPGGPILINLFNSSHSIIGGFSVDGLAFSFSMSHAVIGLTSVQNSRVFDLELTNINGGGAGKGALDFTNSNQIIGENIFVQGASTSGSIDYACGFFGASSSHFKNITCSNHNRTAFFGSGGGAFRGVSGDNGLIIENGLFDECNAATACTVFTAGYANFIGGWIGVGNSAPAMSIDATSKVWLTDVNCGQFGSSASVSNCASIAAGGELNSTMSDLRGNTTGAVITGPAGAVFNSIGGNKIENCVAGVCTPLTAAQYATLGFTGGIVPKSSETHTPNTCYAVTGNLLATAQNLCTFLNDQNYQVLNITAQSGGNAPANSSCTGAPVITLSDGTRTATLTMTTGKTQWSSAIDVSTVNSVFATGTTLTISIGANTCATPPVNVAVSYVLQSVLNP